MKCIRRRGEELRLGYTTGSCAAAAAKAAAIGWETGSVPDVVQLRTPAGIELTLRVEDARMEGDTVRCAVRKDAGDDPDVTDGMLIYARLMHRPDQEISIDGGEGIGTIRKKGLFGEVGQKAINPVPRRMIEEAVRSVTDDGFDVTIYAPDGERIAKNTYNANLGIEGGISIIGTSGIVYPMSEEAILRTIELEIDVVRAEYGTGRILLVPGNYGEKMKERMKIDWPHVQMSNYVGDALKMAVRAGFRRIALLGHIGKFSKLSIGAFQTHSAYCDTRLEAIEYHLLRAGGPASLAASIRAMTTAEEAALALMDAGWGHVLDAMERSAEAHIRRYLKDEALEVEVHIYTMERALERTPLDPERRKTGRIRVAGIGPGDPDLLTAEVRSALAEAQTVLAFRRVKETLDGLRTAAGRPELTLVRTGMDILDYLTQHPAEDVLILASGDPSFYGIVDFLRRASVVPDAVLPGISSIQMMAARLQKSWQDALLVSAHGREVDYHLLPMDKTIFFLTDREHTPSAISKALFAAGHRGPIVAGCDLSYPGERMIRAQVGDDLGEAGDVAVVVVR